MIKLAFEIFYTLLAVYCLYQGISLWGITPDGDGIGFHPFGIELLIPNRSIGAMSNLMILLGVLFLLVPLFIRFNGRDRK